MSFPDLFKGSPPGSKRQRQLEFLILLALGLFLSVLLAYLIVTGHWRYSVGLLGGGVMAILLHRYPFLAILVWLLLDPFLMATKSAADRQVYWAIHRALPLATVLVIMLSSLLRIRIRPLKIRLAEIAMLGYVVASLFSIIYLNPEPQATAYLFYDRVISPMSLYLVLRLSAPGAKPLKRLMYIVFFLALSQSFIGLLSWIEPAVLPDEWLGKQGARTVGSLVNTTTYSITLMFAGLLCLQYGLTRNSKWVRNLHILAFSLTIFGLFFSFSRASWLGLVLVLGGLAFLYPKFITRMVMIMVLTASLFGGVIALRFNWVGDWVNQRLYSEEAQVSAFSRLPVFLAAARMFQEKPVLGWGYGNFDLYDRQFQGQLGEFVGDNKDHASHNFFLTLIAEQGLLGFTLFLLPALFWLYQSYKAWPHMPSSGFVSRKLLAMLWLIILNAIILINFSNLRVVFGWGVWWLTLGLIASIVQPYTDLLPQRSIAEKLDYANS